MLNMLKRIIATAVVLFALGGTAAGQGQYGVFSVDPSNSSNIILDGPIGQSAGLDFRRISRAYPNADTLILNSGGGLLSIGILIADEVYEEGISTIIPRGAGCYSACAFIFFAGRGRTAIGELGVHQFSSDLPNQVGDQYAFADIVDIFDRFGVNTAVLSIMMRTPPDDMYVFSNAEISEYGINRTGAAVVVALPGAAAAQTCEGPWLLSEGFVSAELEAVPFADRVADFERAVDCAERGDAKAQTVAGDMYYFGYGVERDDAKALRLFQAAATQGYAYGQHSLGLMYQNGYGVEQDYAEAVRWYRLAADQGYAYAQTSLGEAYWYGQGVAQSYSEALLWFRPAANQGHARGQYYLGGMYYFGDGVAQSYSEALLWFRLAADQGDILSQTFLGQMYYDGDVVPQSIVHAYKWYILASSSGDGPAWVTDYKEDLAGEMTSAQISEAQRLAREWMAAHPN
jgi:TPR repeat protein